MQDWFNDQTGKFLKVILGNRLPKWDLFKSAIFNRVFHYKPSILGYPYFWKHPYSVMIRVSEQIGYDHSRIEKVVGLPSRQNR